MYIVFADIRGYTAFTNTAGDAEAAKILLRLYQISHSAAQDLKAFYWHTFGDSTLALFETQRDACRFATKLHLAYANGVLSLGAAITSGDVHSYTVDGERLVAGAAINLASRLCNIAAASETLCHVVCTRGAKHCTVYTPRVRDYHDVRVCNCTRDRMSDIVSSS